MDFSTDYKVLKVWSFEQSLNVSGTYFNLNLNQTFYLQVEICEQCPVGLKKSIYPKVEA